MKVNKTILVVGAVLVVVVYAIFIYLAYLWANGETHWKTVLEQNRAKWESQHITHYRMSLTLPFSSNDYDRMPLTVEVQDSEVISVVDNQGKIVSSENDDDFAYYYQNFFTVPGLFSYVHQYYLEKPPAIRVSYDPTLGFPNSIYIDPYTEPCCQDFTIEVRDFQVLP